jgi:diguanylate cyclase (GGDEF)-like protein/hemerythrin-like metal-binding protein/PAS domain S-box-containing protein
LTQNIFTPPKVRSMYVLLLLAIFAIGSTIGANLYKEYKQTGIREQERLLTQNRVISKNISTNLESTNSVLSSLQNDLHHLTPNRKFNEKLILLADAMPGVRTIFILNAIGDVVASNRPEVLDGKNLSRRDYFLTPKKRPDRDLLYISEPFQTLTGFYAVNLTKVILDNGKFDGVITMTLDPEYFSTLLSSVLYSKDMFAVVEHYDGTIFMTAPNMPEWVGKNINKPGTNFYKHRESGLRTTFQAGNIVLHNRNDLAAFSTVQHPTVKFDKPFVVTTSRSRSNIYELWRRDALKQGGLFLLFVFFSVFGLKVFLKHQKEYEVNSAQAAASLLEKSEELDRFFSLALDMFCITDTKGYFRHLNAAWESTLGYSADELAGGRLLDYVHPEDLEATRAAMNDLSREQKSFKFVNRYCCKDGSYRWLEWRSFPYGTELVYAAARDITDHRKDKVALEEANQRLEALTITDGLTGIANRRCFDEVLAKEYARHFRSKAKLALILLDIDYFKEFNDSYGHIKGDECLQNIARSIAKATTRAADLVSRYGGEEFACILPETDLKGAIVIAEKIRSDILALAIPHNKSKAANHITASLGVVAVKCTTDNSIMDILTQADNLLYRAKSSGRNRVEYVASNNESLISEEEGKGYLVELVWKDSFCCGNQLIDSQHQSLFNISNELLEAILLSHPKSIISSIVVRLLSEITQHFQDEELFLESKEFPNLKQHAEEHSKLLKEGLELAEEFKADKLTVGHVFQFLVSDVVEHHMLGADKEYFPFTSTVNIVSQNAE